MSTLFISDLHLENARPLITNLLGVFLQTRARTADALYILGDLFESWIGDDFLDDTARRVAADLADLARNGVPIFFMHGNRDFLLGKDYAAMAGFSLLPESVVINFYGVPTLLLHVDTLCTDDVEYQKFRSQVRNPQFQAGFLRLPVEQRLAMAAGARDASKKHTGKANMSIMDVNEQAVVAEFERNGIVRMIHGHTHRPAFHQHALSANAAAERIVLSEWHGRGSFPHGSYLEVDENGCRSVPLEA